MGPVSFDWTRDVVHLGERECPVAVAGAHGEVRLGGDDGPVLRPLTFGERWRAVSRARASAAPSIALARLVHETATVRAGTFDLLGQQVVALALAHDQAATLSYADTAILLSRAGGAGLAAIDDVEAAEVDRLALRLGDAADEWTRIAFGAPRAGSLEQIRESLAQLLLRRDDSAALRAQSVTGSACNAQVAGVDGADARLGVPENAFVSTALRGASPASAQSIMEPTVMTHPRQASEPRPAQARPRAILPATDTTEASHHHSPPRFHPGAQIPGARLAPEASADPLPRRVGWRSASMTAVAPLTIGEPLSPGATANPNPVSWPEPKPPGASIIALHAPRATLAPWRPELFAIDGQSAPFDGRIAGHAPDERSLDLDEVAELLARLLDRESDLRGLDL